MKNLQQVVNDYYKKRPMEVMSRLEQQTTDIMNVMYDSVTNDIFDRVLDWAPICHQVVAVSICKRSVHAGVVQMF